MNSQLCRILFIGDIMGKPGRHAVSEAVPALRRENSIDLVIGNCENASGGKGVQRSALEEMMKAGVDLFTSGNHIWDKDDVYECLERKMPLLHPANYPKPTDVPLKSSEPFILWKSPRGFSVGVINVMGRVFMDSIDCPFQTVQAHLPKMEKVTPILFVDMHCEASSEKAAMAWYLDGRVSAVIGSHTHVPTADGRLLPRGTAFQTDAGMTGPYDSIIGMQVKPVLDKFLTKRPHRFEVATKNIWFSSVMVSIDVSTGRAKDIQPIRRFIE